MIKHCNKCDTDKPLSEFHKRKASKDGHSAMCKLCQRERDQKRYDENRDDMLEKRRAYQKIEAGKAAHFRATQKYKETSPKKRAAHIQVGNALRGGLLRKGPCEICGTTRQVVGHHDDYDRPLSVRWLCERHHKEWHRENGEAKNAV